MHAPERGIWLTANEPLPPFQGQPDTVVLCINIPPDVFDRHVTTGETACVPAAVLNRLPRWLL